MNAARTPGMWTVFIAPAGICDMIVGEEGERICEFPYGADEGTDGANAAFIVTACNAHDELVAALEAEQEWRDRERAGALDHEWDYEVMVGAKRRAALAKVRP